MSNFSKLITATAVFLTLNASSVFSATIERAGGAKVVGEPHWVSAITVQMNDGERIKLTTEKEAAGRNLEAGDSFDQLIIAPEGSFSISSPYSVQGYVEERFGEPVEILFNNGDDENSHW